VYLIADIYDLYFGIGFAGRLKGIAGCYIHLPKGSQKSLPEYAHPFANYNTGVIM